MRLWLVPILLLTPAVSQAQALALEWQSSLGGSSGDGGRSRVVQTSDGGYAILGWTASSDGQVTGQHGDGDVWLAKVDANGSLIWQHAYGGSGWDEGRNLWLCNDGGFIICGFSSSADGDATDNHGGWDAWVIRTDSSGGIVWENSVGGSSDDVASSIRELPNGGFLVAGTTYSNDGDVAFNHGVGSGDAWLFELDATGVLLWEKTFGGTSEESALQAFKTSDGGYFLAGGCASNDGDVFGLHASEDGWAVRLDSARNIIWQRALGGTRLDQFVDAVEVAGGFVLAGWTESSDGDVIGLHPGVNDEGGPTPDGWVVKLDDANTIIWQRPMGGSGYEYFWGVTTDPSGNILLNGSATSNNGNVSGGHGGEDRWVVKLNGFATTQWQLCLGGTGQETGFGVAATADGGVISVGSSNSDDGDVSGNHGLHDLWAVKLEGTATNVSGEGLAELTVFPSPTAHELKVECPEQMLGAEYQVLDMTGHMVLRGVVTGPMTVINARPLTSGEYFIVLTKESDKVIGRFTRE